MQASFDLAIEYAKARVQFDRPIATFQATKHKAAEMLERIELSRVGTHYAAWTSDADEPDAGRGGRHGEVVRGQGRQRGHRRGHPDPRRRRLHLGVRRPPLLPAGQGQRPAVGYHGIWRTKVADSYLGAA